MDLAAVGGRLPPRHTHQDLACHHGAPDAATASAIKCSSRGRVRRSRTATS
jgi:hypothetical protein